MNVTLSPWEFHQCVNDAGIRFLQARINGIADNYHPDGGRREGRNWLDHIAIEIMGVCAERAFCKATGRYAPRPANAARGEPDLDGVIEIRGTDKPHGCLILHADDSDDCWFVLVTGCPPDMTIRGAIRGRDGKRRQWWRDPTDRGRWAYFVPQGALTPLRRREAQQT